MRLLSAVRLIVSLAGIMWLAGLTRYPEATFGMLAIALHWRGLGEMTRRVVDEKRAIRARRRLRIDWHAEVGALDALMARE